MDKAEIFKDEIQASYDISALVREAIEQKKQEEREKAVRNIEETPAGEKLTWNTTAEEIAQINAGEREALDKFYFNNLRRIMSSAMIYIRNNWYVKAVANYEDLMQQVYCDLRLGLIRLRPFDRAISKAIFHSFRYAPVGGLDEEYCF